MERSYLGPINQPDGDMNTYLNVFVLAIDSFLHVKNVKMLYHVLNISNYNMTFRITIFFFQNLIFLKCSFPTYIFSCYR